MQRKIALFTLTAVIGIGLASIAGADEYLGKYRIYLMNNRSVAGEVTELDDGSYEVKNKYGMVFTIRQHQVKDMVPLEQEQNVGEGDQPSPGDETQPEHLRRRMITDAEIEELLSGVTLDLPDHLQRIDPEDLHAPLPVNEAHVQEMLRQAGPQAKVLERDHWVMVYTGSDESAQKLGSRLETIWKWNYKFIDQLNLRPIRPEYKLEVFYFGTHEEFQKYSLNISTNLPGGVMGYYTHDVNRSHFFDLWYMPMLDGPRRVLESGNLHPSERRRLKNRMERWVEHNNLEVIQHEAGHHIHFNTGVFTQRGEKGGLAPTWLVEGATMMFETPPSTTGRGGSSLGDFNDPRLDGFRKLYPRWSPEGLKMFVVNNMLWYQGYNYPRGWALVYYLWMEYRDGLGKYIKRIHEREQAGEGWTMTQQEMDFEEFFGEINEEWVDRFYDYLDDLEVRQSRLPPELFR